MADNMSINPDGMNIFTSCAYSVEAKARRVSGNE